ncbi:MAG: ATP-binding cassette domain-containing protein [Clostridia bacterium]|nr:ATP-binding cassette domain-containing protein [Clostridia bacterium]
MAYTFSTVIDNAVSIYLGAPDKNEREKKRFDRQTKKYESIVAKGKTPDWAVVPASYVDIDLARQNIKRLIERLYNHYAEVLENAPSRDFDQASVDIIDYLKENAANSVRYVSKQMAKHRALKLMEEVGIPEPRKRYMQYPFEFSGGMRQRIVIAIALSADPDILICDEPTTALDVTIQAQILELINKIKAQRNLSIIFITHDLGVVANMADKIAVMYAGKIVEYGTADDIFYRPAHPYTWALLSSMPDLDTNEKLEAIPGTPPNMIYPPKGDAFAERNKYAMQIDFEAQPPMFKISDTHSAATWLLHPDAPKVEMPKIVSERIKKMKKVGGAGNE